MERKVFVDPHHLSFLNLPEDAKAFEGRDASECGECPHIKIQDGRPTCSITVIIDLTKSPDSQTPEN